MPGSQTSNAAVNNNERIFPIFAQRLASTDPELWRTTAKKLTQWLRSERAYYTAAQPKITVLERVPSPAERTPLNFRFVSRCWCHLKIEARHDIDLHMT
ncbi:hypothetical protein BJ138DRAFT_650139 [Hygrophoropsis aurantiaca]|uniref:Uncharacterized protein n=1 Tax=Hygrophoropsis aurantiaca TaxID=72124 RepID=A0ACB7ZZL4_9AGAM|nr:hypothetical protein BJ138DRAFT_650139 [Hygrophoropsis aurantiaca]